MFTVKAHINQYSIVQLSDIEEVMFILTCNVFPLKVWLADRSSSSNNYLLGGSIPLAISITCDLYVNFLNYLQNLSLIYLI